MLTRPIEVGQDPLEDVERLGRGWLGRGSHRFERNPSARDERRQLLARRRYREDVLASALNTHERIVPLASVDAAAGTLLVRWLPCEIDARASGVFGGSASSIRATSRPMRIERSTIGPTAAGPAWS